LDLKNVLYRLDEDKLYLLLDSEFNIASLREQGFIKIELNDSETLVQTILETMKNRLLTDNNYLVLVCNGLEENEWRNLSEQLGFPLFPNKQSFLKKIRQLRLNKKDVQNKLKSFFKIKERSENLRKEKNNVISAPSKRFYELLNYQFIIREQLLAELTSQETVLPRMIVHMPTGTGKTKTTVHSIIHNYVLDRNGEGILIWLAHTHELLEQALGTFKEVWSSLGAFSINAQYNHQEILKQNKSIYFLSYQKLISLFKNDFETFKILRDHAAIIVADEAHKCLALETSRALENLMKSFNDNLNKSLIGLTATPGRKLSYFDDEEENRRLSNMFEKRIINIDPEQIESLKKGSGYKWEEEYIDIENKDKTIIEYFQHHGVLARIKRKALDYHMSSKDESNLNAINRFIDASGDLNHQAREAFSKISSRNLVILKELIRLHENNIPTIVFACSVPHGRLLENLLKLSGIDSSGVYGDTPRSERKRAIEDFSEDRVNIIINYDVLTTGFDSPRIKAVFITRPTTSIVLYSQMLGRGLRGPLMGGNTECELIDIQDNLERYSSEEEAYNYFNEYWS